MRRVRSIGRPAIKLPKNRKVPSVKIILSLPGLCAAKDVEGIAEHFWTMKGIKLIPPGKDDGLYSGNDLMAVLEGSNTLNTTSGAGKMSCRLNRKNTY